MANRRSDHVNAGSPGYSKRGSQAPLGRLNEGGSQEAKGTSPPPVADEGLVPFPQRSKNRRNSVSPNGFSGTARRTEIEISPPCRNAIPGPASRRPANGAAAEIAALLLLPPAAQGRNSPPECHFLCPFLLDKQKKGGSYLLQRKEKNWTSSLVRMRSGAAGQYSFAFLFPHGGAGKEITVSTSVCTGRCRPPMWPADMIPLKGLGASKERASPIIMRRRESAQRAKKRIPIRVSAFLELLGRFELPTSSLPRMRSTY